MTALLFASVAFVTLQAGAVTSFGPGPAQDCFEAAQAGSQSQYAIQQCATALETQPLSNRDKAATVVNRGIIRLHRREAADALADFDLALRWAPDLAEARVNRGAALVLLSRFDEAITDITRGIDLGADQLHEAYFNRALAYERKGDVKAAYADFQKAVALKPDWQLAQAELSRFTVSRR